MAANDIIVFEQSYLDLGLGLHDLAADVLQVAYVDNTIVPTAATPDPRWGLGGGTDLSANEVSGGTFPAGGTDINGTYVLDLGEGKLDGDDLSHAQNGANPVDLYWAILFNVTSANRCILAMDMGGPVNGQVSPVTITWDATGILRLRLTP